MEVNSKEVYRESDDTYSVLYQVPTKEARKFWDENLNTELFSIDENGKNGESGQQYSIFSIEDLNFAVENKHDIYYKRYYEQNK